MIRDLFYTGNTVPMQPIGIAGHWIPIRDGDPRAKWLQSRHYSCHHYKDGRKIWKIMGPGEYMLLMTVDCRALFAWRKFVNPDGQQGVYCPIFRNEGQTLSSELIREACDLAWQRWPGQRLYTYVDPRRIRSTNPGYCFLQAGWKRCGESKSGKIILEILPQEPL